MKTFRLILWFTLCALALACGKGGGGEEAPRATEAAPEPKAPAAAVKGQGLAGTTIIIDGEHHTFKAKDNGYKTSGGLKFKVEADRVKVKNEDDQELCKIKKKDDGFKLYQKGGEEAVLKGKRRGDGFKLMKKPSDEELGRVENGGGTLGGQPVVVSGGEVKRNGETVAKVGTGIPATAAALLGATELSKAERLGMLVYVLEVEK